MNLLKLAAQIILIYLLYRLVVDFIIPTFRTVSRFRRQFRQMQNEMRKHFEDQQRAQGKFTSKQDTPNEDEKAVSKGEGEYIDFEEVKG